MARKATNDPALNLEEEQLKEKKFKLPQSVVQLLEDYVEFYGQAKGTKPTQDKVVAAGLERGLSSDPAFKKWLRNRGNGNGGGGQTSS